LPDYQEYYDYDYQTGQYTTADTDTATLGQYYDYQYHGDTSTQGYSDQEYSHNDTSDAFIQTVTEDVAEDFDNNEKYNFFPVKDIFQQKLIDMDSEEESTKSDKSEEVNIVSLLNTSEKEESDESPDSTLHYEIISNTVEATDSENSIFSVDDDTLVDADEDINRLHEINHNVLTDVAGENSTEKDKVETIIEETSSLSSETIEEDVFDNSADEASILPTHMTEEFITDTTYHPSYDLVIEESAEESRENDSVAESSEFESDNLFKNIIVEEDASGLEFPEEALNVHVEEINSEGSSEIDEKIDDIIKEGFEVTTNDAELSLVYEHSGSGDEELPESESAEKKVTNIKSVKVKVNVKSADDIHSQEDIVINTLKFQAPKDFVSDITRQIESGGEDLNMLSDYQDILYSHSGTRLSEHDNSLLFMCLIALSLNFKCCFQE